MNEETRQATVDLYVRRFLFSHGDRSALAPHEVEGLIAELRHALALFDAVDTQDPALIQIREGARRQLALYEEMA